jgi:hypothetical protein
MSGRRPARRDEVPEADALEQNGGDRNTSLPRTDDIVDDDTVVLDESLEVPADVPEADALDQAVPAFVDDEWRDDDR